MTNRFSKSSFYFLLKWAVCTVALIGLCRCDHYTSDYIVDDFVLDYSGSDGDAIVLTRREGLDLIIVDSRVDEYKVDSTNIYASRNPKILIEGGGIVQYKLSNKCEYWIINRKTHEAKKVDFLSNVHCK